MSDGYSYESLAECVQQIEFWAIRADLEQRGFAYLEDQQRFVDANVTDEQVSAAVTSTISRYSDVPAMFTPFYRLPDPQGIGSYAAALSSVAAKLNRNSTDSRINGSVIGTNADLDGIDDINAMITNWTGEAAIAFRSKFVRPWDSILTNQLTLVLALKGAVQTEEDVFREARKSVTEVANAALNAIKALCSSNSGGLLDFKLTVLASVFALGSLATGGAMSISLAIVGEVFSSAGAFPYKEAEVGKFTGGTPIAILGQLREELAKLQSQIVDGETQVAKSMQSALDVVSGSGSRDHVVTPRPQLADDTSADIRDQKFGLGESKG